MAYVNVLEWKAEQVSEWLRGLDDSIYPYAHFFLNNNVTGQGLLNLTVDDLYKLHVEKLGHQELILESLDHLKNFHFNLDQENLQYICLKLSCKARSLYNEIMMLHPPGGDSSKQTVTGPVMSAVSDVLDSVRILLSWLHRKPFDTKEDFFKVRTTLISLSLELATNTHREAFAEQPIDVIRSCCDKLADVADQVIQEVRDPLLLQPASLDVATVRKKTQEELGVVVVGGLGGIHLVAEVNMLNPSTRIQPGDEIVQVNYQTVVGWETKKVLQLMGENPGEVILTLKKRPKHTNLIGQVYTKPFRIPARKKSAFIFNNLPSPRTELLVVPDVSLPIKKRIPSVESITDQANSSDSDSENDEAFLPVAAAEVAGQIERHKPAVSPTSSLRSVLSRPRSAPLRRATISGSLPRSRPYLNVGETWGDSPPTTGTDYSTIDSRDSGVSTLSAKQDFQLRQREGGGPAPPRPATIAQVTSAPNLRTAAAAAIDAAAGGFADSGTATNAVSLAAQSVDDVFEAAAAPPPTSTTTSTVQYRNGSLNIQLTSPTSSGPAPLLDLSPAAASAQHQYSQNSAYNSPRRRASTSSSCSSPGSSGSSSGMSDADRIVLKVSHSPQAAEVHSSGQSSSEAGVSRVSVYMNVPGHENNAAVDSATASDRGMKSAPYVNYNSDLVNTTPLPKPRAARAASIASSPAAAAGGGNPDPIPAPADGSATLGGRGRRPVPLPRRFSTADSPSASVGGGGGRSGGGGPADDAANSRVSPRGAAHSRPSAATPRPPPVRPGTPAGRGAGGRGPGAGGGGGGGPPTQKITPTASYKSYRRVAPEVPHLPKVAPAPEIAVGGNSRRRLASADSDGYTEIADLVSPAVKGLRISGPTTRQFPAAAVGASGGGVRGRDEFGRPIVNWNSRPTASSSAVARLSFDGPSGSTAVLSPPKLLSPSGRHLQQQQQQQQRTGSVSSCDSGLAGSLSPTTPTAGKVPPALPALPPRNPSSSSSSKF